MGSTTNLTLTEFNCVHFCLHSDMALSILASDSQQWSMTSFKILSGQILYRHLYTVAYKVTLAASYCMNAWEVCLAVMFDLAQCPGVYGMHEVLCYESTIIEINASFLLKA